MTLTATVTTTHEVVLKPTIRRKLLTELKAYAELKQQLDAIKHAMDKHKTTIGGLREATGEKALSLEGFSIRLVEPVRSVLDKKKLVELGCSTAWIAEATVAKPAKSYEKISCPGEREHEEYD